MTNLSAANNLDATVVDIFRGSPITRGEFKSAFDQVADKANWKNMVDAEADLADERAIYTMRQAVIFFTGSVPEIFPVAPGRYRVMAAGYYEACGA